MTSGDAEINLHGSTPYELRWKLIPFLDRGLTENWTNVKIIHGIGRGVLRDEVWAILDDLDYIVEYKLAPRHEGGRGVTVANYREGHEDHSRRS